MDYLFRGFHEYEDGKQIAVVDGKEHKGIWIEGYIFKIWHEYYILWGTTNGIPNMLEVLPETVGMWTGLTDKIRKKIFEGDRVIPVWVSPSGEIDGLDEDMQGKVIYKAGSFYVAPSCEMEYGINKFVKRKFIEYRSNVGDIYDFENNIFLGEVIGTIFDKEE